MPVIAFLKEYGEALEDMKAEQKHQEQLMQEQKRKAKMRRRH